MRRTSPGATSDKFGAAAKCNWYYDSLWYNEMSNYFKSECSDIGAATPKLKHHQCYVEPCFKFYKRLLNVAALGYGLGKCIHRWLALCCDIVSSSETLPWICDWWMHLSAKSLYNHFDSSSCSLNKLDQLRSLTHPQCMSAIGKRIQTTGFKTSNSKIFSVQCIGTVGN